MAEDTTPVGNSASSESAPRDPAKAMYTAPLIVIGTVKAVNGPFWNQTNGQRWEEKDAGLPTGWPYDHTSPFMYQEVTLEISEVVRDELALTDEGRTLVAEAKTQGVEAASTAGLEDPTGGDQLMFIAPTFMGFEPGEQILTMLEFMQMLMRETSFIVIGTHEHSHGTYHLLDRRGTTVAVPDFAWVEISTGADNRPIRLTAPDPAQVEAALPIEALVALIGESRAVENREWELDRFEFKPGWVESTVRSTLKAIADLRADANQQP